MALKLAGVNNFRFHDPREGQIVFCLTPSPPIWDHDRRSTFEFQPEVFRSMTALMPSLAAGMCDQGLMLGPGLGEAVAAGPG